MIEIQLKGIKKLMFSKQDVVMDDKSKSLRKYNLKRAMALGNLYKRKVKIYFRTVDGYAKRVEATVWAVGEDFISFKSGISLPIKSVEEVEF